LWQATLMMLVLMAGVVRAARTNSTTNGYRRLKYEKPGGRSRFLLMASLLTALLLIAPAAEAESGDFSIDFVAAAPQSYNHLTGGGAFDDRTIGVDKDVVESLEGGDFTCGDIVTYFAEVTVGDTQSAVDDQPQTIEMNFSFLADTTGQSGVAIGEIVLVQVNYGTIEDLIAYENSVDDGISDDGGSTATLTYEHLTGPLFTSKSELHGTVKLDDLEQDETVVVRIDVKLFCDPGSYPTGNLQGALSSARLTYSNGNEVDEAIPGGEQTIPFKQLGNICTPELEIQKTVTTAGGSCPGVETLTVTAGDTVKYCYVITNPSSCAPLYNVEVVDDSGTIGTGDDFTVTISTGLSDEDGDGSDDDLAAGGTATGEATVTLTEAGTVINIATATGDDSIIEPTTLEASDPATVIVGAPSTPPPVINVNKTAKPTSVLETGGYVEFIIRVTNNGSESVTIDSLFDTDFNLGAACPDAEGTLFQPDEIYTCGFTKFISGTVGEDHVNTVTVVASDDDGNRATDWDNATVEFTATPPVTPTPVPTTTPPVTPTPVPTMTTIGTVLLTGLLGLIGAGLIMKRR
jgi:hypothetical protein